MFTCPNCSLTVKENIPLEVYELRSICRSRKALFSGLLVGDRWRGDRQIVKWMEDGLVELVEGQGFVATKEAFRFVQDAGLQI